METLLIVLIFITFSIIVYYYLKMINRKTEEKKENFFIGEIKRIFKKTNELKKPIRWLAKIFVFCFILVVFLLVVGPPLVFILNMFFSTTDYWNDLILFLIIDFIALFIVWSSFGPKKEVKYNDDEMIIRKAIVMSFIAQMVVYIYYISGSQVGINGAILYISTQYSSFGILYSVMYILLFWVSLISSIYLVFEFLRIKFSRGNNFPVKMENILLIVVIGGFVGVFDAINYIPSYFNSDYLYIIDIWKVLLVALLIPIVFKKLVLAKDNSFKKDN